MIQPLNSELTSKKCGFLECNAEVNLEYLSTGCNPAPNVIDWGHNGLIVFGVCNSVIVYNPTFYSDCGKVIKILNGHQKAITCLKWIKKCSNIEEQELISSSADGRFIVWKYGEMTFNIVDADDREITLIDAFYSDFSNRSLTVITISANDAANIWYRDGYQGEMTKVQQLQFKNELCTAIDSFHLTIDDDYLKITAIALTDFQIKLYSCNQDNHLFEEMLRFVSKSKDWIRSFSFRKFENDVFLLTSSQDDYIRLYRINIIKNDKSRPKEVNEFRPDDLEQNINSLEIVGCVQFNQFYLSVRLETVICGNEGSVYEINWSPTPCFHNEQVTQNLEFISCSIDKSIIIWQWDRDNSGLWVEKYRLGQIGGNTLGFYGCKFSPDGKSFIANSYQGSLHLWTFCDNDQLWRPGVMISGHFNEVNDIAWDPTGEFLISVSSDKSSRIHGLWKRRKENAYYQTWHEISRPQIHGHAIFCIATISRYVFASGAEEKIIRVFKSTMNFFHHFRKICQIEDSSIDDLESMPKGASVPSLGLSNQAIYVSNTVDERSNNRCHDDDNYNLANLKSKLCKVPPNEDELREGTLWPEIQKLYGHGYEIFAMASSENGEFLASSCKSTNKEFASILIWNISTWEICDKLTHHNLTVTQIEFSPDSEKLLAVSRDRTWSLYKRIADKKQFQKIAYSDKTNGIHSRIIWTCSWSYDSHYFVTGSREGKVVLWSSNNETNNNTTLQQYGQLGPILNLVNCSVMALCFAPISLRKSAGNYLLAIGFENGDIKLYEWSLESHWRHIALIDKNNSFGHQLIVKRLRFQKNVANVYGDNNKQIFKLASCSCDYTVRIYDIRI